MMTPRTVSCFASLALTALAACSVPADRTPAATAAPVPPDRTAGDTSTTTPVAQDAPGPSSQQVQYSPYPARTYPDRAYFGDTHLHTSYSTDAGMIGNSLGPEEAYRFARGETVMSSTGLKVKLGRPLDWLVIADHAENLGLAPAISESNPDLLKNTWGREQHDLVKSGRRPAGSRPTTTGWPRWGRSPIPCSISPDFRRPCGRS